MRTLTTLVASMLLLGASAATASGPVMIALDCPVPGVPDQPGAQHASHDDEGSVLYDLAADRPRVVALQPGIGHDTGALEGLLGADDQRY